MLHLIIGVGSIGSRYAKILLYLGEDVIGCDPNTPYNDDFTIYRNIDWAYADNPDVVWVCSPTNLHFGHAIMAIREGKHVFIEKPMASSIEDAKLLATLCEEHNKVTWISSNLKYHKYMGYAKNIVENWRLGPPMMLRLKYSSDLRTMRPNTDYKLTYAADKSKGGGIILDCIQYIDVAVWLNGKIKSMTGIANSSGILGDIEDTASISILHVNNCLTNISLDYFGTPRRSSIELVWIKNVLYQELPKHIDDMYTDQIIEFLDTVRNNHIFPYYVKESLYAIQTTVFIQ